MWTLVAAKVNTHNKESEKLHNTMGYLNTTLHGIRHKSGAGSKMAKRFFQMMEGSMVARQLDSLVVMLNTWKSDSLNFIQFKAGDSSYI